MGKSLYTPGVVPPTPPGYLSDTQSSGQTLPISTSLSTKPLSDSGAHGGLGGEASPCLVMHRRETAEPQRCSGHTGETAEPWVPGNKTASGFWREGPAIAYLLSLPSSGPRSQSLDRWLRPESDPPVLSQPGGARENSGDSPGGTSLLPQPASCPFPGSHWRADPRENQHLGLPSTARRPQRGKAES